MNYAYQTESAVTNLLKFEIGYSSGLQNYIFKSKRADEYEESSFNSQIDEIKSLLHLQLKIGSKQKEYLQNLIDQIWKRMEWLNEHKAHSPEFIEFYSKKIFQFNEHGDKNSTNEDAYKRFIADNEKISSKDFELFNFLKFQSEKMNHFKNINDFTKGILLYAINIYRDALIELYNYIYSIHMNAEFIDFKTINLEQLSHISTSKGRIEKCDFNLDKMNVAHLFRILIEEKVIVFDELNKTKNLYKMKKFVEENFTYQNSKKERIYIETFNREYSEISAHQGINDNKKHKEFIDYLILKLQRRKDNL